MWRVLIKRRQYDRSPLSHWNNACNERYPQDEIHFLQNNNFYSFRLNLVQSRSYDPMHESNMLSHISTSPKLLPTLQTLIISGPLSKYTYIYILLNVNLFVRLGSIYDSTLSLSLSCLYCSRHQSLNYFTPKYNLEPSGSFRFTFCCPFVGHIQRIIRIPTFINMGLFHIALLFNFWPFTFCKFFIWVGVYFIAKCRFFVVFHTKKFFWNFILKRGNASYRFVANCPYLELFLASWACSIMNLTIAIHIK